MKLPMDMTGVTWAKLSIHEHGDGGRFLIIFSTNFGSVEKEFNSERSAVREYKKIHKALNRMKPAHVFSSGWATELCPN